MRGRGAIELLKAIRVLDGAGVSKVACALLLRRSSPWAGATAMWALRCAGFQPPPQCPLLAASLSRSMPCDFRMPTVRSA